MNNGKSTNRAVLEQIMSGSRRYDLPPQVGYIILYTFLYKYCSDTVRDFLLFELKDKELTIDEAYKNRYCQEQLIFDSMNMNGFYMKSSESFIDEVVSNNYDKPGFLPDFLKVFPESIMFSSQYHNAEYFDYLFETVANEIDTFKFTSEQTHVICKIVYLISQLDVLESEFTFSDAFDIISASSLMEIESNPKFINQILSRLVLSEKKTIKSAYDPFIKDGSTIMNLYESIGYGLKQCYGKDSSKLNYFHTLVRFFINNMSFNDVFLRHENAIDSIDIDGASFDVILSKIPIAIKNYYSSNVTQTREIAKRSRRSELESLLLDNFGMDGESFKQDSELNRALENLVEKIDLENGPDAGFTGQYEPLKSSEFLFLLNLVDSLEKDGIMVVSISENFLFKDSLEILRKYLAYEKNYIDAVIRIPNEIVRSRPEVVIVFRKNRNTDDILFIDMSARYETQRGGRPYPGLFRKNLVLDTGTMEKMENVFLNKLTIPKYSNLVSIDEIQKNNFNLSVSRYVDTFEGEFISLDEVMVEKREIESSINELDLKIKKMMDDLDIRF